MIATTATAPAGAGFKKNLRDTVLPAGIVAMILMMVLPLPSVLLDIFFTANILISLVIVMVSLNTFRPLDFSSFPTVILFATTLRLALNVASTRVVLTDGHTGTDAAGQVIASFSEFIIGGNFAIGIMVFAILVIINLMVITKGAGRVSEVSARFTLDAMPGKQMAIDADLNAGLIEPEDAKTKREEIGKEADFYGAMDGASKFVKGDAIAGLLILAINIIGGLVLGVTQHDMTFGDAAEAYIILSIGDGLVAQIPSILLAIATAIIVTRVSGSIELSDQVSGQLSLTKAWIPVAAILTFLGFIPGMPSAIFLPFAALSIYVAYNLRKADLAPQPKGGAIAGAGNPAQVGGSAGALPAPTGGADNADGETKDGEEAETPVQLDDVSDLSQLSLEVGYGLIALVDQDNGSPLISRITGIRKQVSKDLGFIIPQVRIRDNLALSPYAYRISVGGMIVGEDVAYPDKFLAIDPGNAGVELEGEKTIDPSFGLEATWVEEHERQNALSFDFTVVDSSTVIATHLNQVMVRHSSELLGQDAVQEMLDKLEEFSPQLVKNVVPKVLPLPILTQAMKNLLTEEVPIRDLRRILEAISLVGEGVKNAEELTEMLRPYLAGILVQNICGLKDTLKVVTFEGELEQMLINAARQANNQAMPIDPNLTQSILTTVNTQYDKITADGSPMVIVSSPVIRRFVSRLIRQQLGDVKILAFNELPDSKKIEVVSVIGGEDQTPETEE